MATKTPVAPTKSVAAPAARPAAATARPVARAKAQTAAVHTESKTGLIKTPSALLADPEFIALQKQIDALENSIGFNTTGLIQSGYVKNAIHTGVLMYDFVVGGGGAPGRLTILPGLEGSGKSTIVDNLAAVCVSQGIPVYWFDAESALDPSYVSRIFSRYNLELTDLMGRRDANGRWVVPPVIRYTNTHVGEHVFKMIKGLCDRLPSLRQDHAGVWYRKLEVKGRPDRWEEDPRQGKPPFLFIIDSWPALVPEMRDENIDSAPMASQARMIGAYINTIKGPIARVNAVAFSVNQIRTKPGVTHGCLHADVKIPLADGRSFTIREIVDERIEGSVLSFNETTGALEPKKITGWHDNGLVESAEDWISVKAQAVDTPNGSVSFTVTPDHEVKVGTGTRWKKAKNLKVGDKLVTSRVKKLNGTLLEFMLGKFVGDLNLYADKRAGNAQFKLANSEQPDYLAWSVAKLSPHFQSGQYTDNRGFSVHKFSASSELREWHDRLQGSRSFKAVGDLFTPLSLAVWYMDDGCLVKKTENCYRAVISFKRFRTKPQEAAAVSKMLTRFGIDHTLAANNTSVSVSAAGVKVLFTLIAKFVPPCMQYKLSPEFREQYQEYSLVSVPEVVSVEVPVLEIVRGSSRKFRQKRKFDITVEDNHNYMAGSESNGVIVHNSPEYEPCGMALGFFSDVRTQIRKVSPSTIKAGTGAFTEEPSYDGHGVDRYHYARLKNTKNKSFIPMREGSIRIRFEHRNGPGDGICRTWDVTQFLLATGQAETVTGQRLRMHLKPVTRNGKQNLFEDGKIISRAAMKSIVEDPKNRSILYNHCLAQIRSGYAFEVEKESIHAVLASAPARSVDAVETDAEVYDDNQGVDA